jgi:hypothetical protein
MSSSRKRVKIGPTTTSLIRKSSYEKDPRNYQTREEHTEARSEFQNENIKEDPKYYDKKSTGTRKHAEKTLKRLKDAGYTVKQRSDGSYNVCKKDAGDSLNTAAKCVVVAVIGYEILRALGIMGGSTRKSSKGKKRRFTQKNRRK